MNRFDRYKAADYKKFYLNSSTAGHPHMAVFDSEAFTQINSSLSANFTARFNALLFSQLC